MLKKIIPIILLIFLAGIFFFFYFKSGVNRTSFISRDEKETKIKEKEDAPEKDKKLLFVSGWLPYWSKSEGAESFENNSSVFSEIHPFAFSVSSDGNLVDKLEIKKAPWPELIEESGKNNITVVPAILWGDALSMHRIMTDKNALNNHISAIEKMLTDNDFSGIDIDYEGKDLADKNLFSTFLELLHEKLAIGKKTINCTIEARTKDQPPESWSGTQAMAWANDYSAIDKSCDFVTIMAYDQSFQVNGTHNSFDDDSEMPSAPGADNQWVEEVIRYATGKIAPEKIILGVPTYGWEFEIEKRAAGFHYARFQSVSFPKAIAEAKSAGVTPKRTDGGELSFVYRTDGKEHIVTFPDAEFVRQKIDLAKKYNLKGISLFKIDGLNDPDLFSVFREK